jgi:hypothetical protein
MKRLMAVTLILVGTVRADLTTNAPAATPATPQQTLADTLTTPLKNAQENMALILKQQKLLRSMIIKEMNLKDADLEQTIKFFQAQAKELDPEKNGLNVIVEPDATTAAKDHKVTLQLKNIPCSEALRYSLAQLGLDYKIDPYAVIIVALKRAE